MKDHSWPRGVQIVLVLTAWAVLAGVPIIGVVIAILLRAGVKLW